MANLAKIEDFAVQKMGKDSTGHDYYHALRVRNNALKIAQVEGECDLDVVVAAALLHDVPDPKVCNDIEKAKEECLQVMLDNGMTKEQCEQVMSIILSLGFKGNKEKREMPTKEGKIVQDADRLDAIGAIGIARCFAFGGSRNRLIWDPSQKPQTFENETQYRNSTGNSLNHFDEKLLLLKDLMQTETGRKVAEKRHQTLVEFKQHFIEEWYGEDLNDLIH